MIVQHYKGCLLMQGGILGSHSPSTALQAGLRLMQPRGTAQALCPGEQPQTAQIQLAFPAPRGVQSAAVAQLHCSGRAEELQSRGTMPNQVCSPAHLPPSLSLLQGHPHCSLTPACSLVLWIAGTHIGIALAVPTGCIPVSQQDINIFKKPRL